MTLKLIHLTHLQSIFVNIFDVHIYSITVRLSAAKNYLPGREYDGGILKKNCLNDQIFFGTEKMTS